MHLASVRVRILIPLVVLIVTMLMIGTQGHHASAAAAFGDEQVRKMLMLALDNINRGLCENNKRCAPATEQERANPPITIAEARIVISRGAITAGGEHCGLDWQGRNFKPMMAYWRHKLKKNERQTALIALLHGITQEYGKHGLKVACTDEMRKNIDRQLTFQPPERS